MAWRAACVLSLTVIILSTAAEQNMTHSTDGAKIKRWREDPQWSQQHLTDLAGLGLRTVQRIENGQAASQESLMALANAFEVDAQSLLLDPTAEAANIVRTKNEKARDAIRMSFFIHLAGFLIGVATFIAISMTDGSGYFTMKVPLAWWFVGMVAHAATVLIIEIVTRYQDKTV